MIKATDLSGKLALDANGLNALKQSAKDNSPEAIKGVAKQFEAVFMNMMLKSMREASPQDSPFENEQSRTFVSMLDQQLSSNLSQKGLGLADILAKQLSKASYSALNSMEQATADKMQTLPETKISAFEQAFTSTLQHNKDAPVNPSKAVKTTNMGTPSSTSSIDFQKRMTNHAEAASKATGVPTHLMLGQAALESGWGKRELIGVNGTNSHNLFGIKATGDWDGKVVEAMTTEYINGVKQKRIEKFRAYDSYADSFKDFANLISHHPRYKRVMENLGDIKAYAQAMQKSGYATDPNYANKLASVIEKVAT